ncbi:hypothetical protein [Streptomyces sp. Je 1-332]|uniref:hypothetical protein n=1 Tax=Streptomyces sp. Je 1-332 TaxID=3231270 RepID=UPI00345A8CD9
MATATLAAGALGAAAVPAAAETEGSGNGTARTGREQPDVTITTVPAKRTAPVCSDVWTTIVLANPSERPRTGAVASWPATPGSKKPVASSGEVTTQGRTYVWKGDVHQRGKVTVTQRLKTPCTSGEARAITVTAPGSNCPATVRGGGAPCTSAILAQRVQARPAPQRQEEPVGMASGPRGLAETGDESDTMLYAGLAIALCTLGALAVAAARSRRLSPPPKG